MGLIKSELYKQYTNSLFEQYHYFANWLPDEPRDLGDIGTLDKNYFDYRGSLWTSGFDRNNFPIRQGGSFTDIKYITSRHVSETVKIRGKAALKESALGKMDAGLIVEFNKENSIYFKAKGTKISLISNQIALGDKIIRRYNDGKWKKEWVVVVEKVEADSATCLISSSDKSRIELIAKGNIPTANIDIADASAQFETALSRDLSTQIVAGKNITPLFKLKGIKEEHGEITFGGGEPIGEISFKEVDFEPYEDMT